MTRNVQIKQEDKRCIAINFYSRSHLFLDKKEKHEYLCCEFIHTY